MPAGATARVFNIPTGVAFLDALAEGILSRDGDSPLALSRVTVLLPTRRACRALRDAFLRRTEGRPTLLPRLRPVGDVDDDELAIAGDEGGLDLAPSIPPLRRLLVLARAILALERAAGERTPPQAVDLAAELARLLDQVQTERLGFARLEKLVPEEHAEHWRRTIKFLEILTENWPKILETEGGLDPTERRNLVLTALARHWMAHPPAGPVYAAGSTGSIPAVADLLAVIAQLPRGAVILPGLDGDLDAESWDALDETHPQYGLRQLLARLGVTREAVETWSHGMAPAHATARRHLLSAALRPAATTAAWRELAPVPAEAVAGLKRIDCAHPQHEAQVIALLLRQALETPGRTAALITPDRALARRVCAEIGRFGVSVDDSAGRPLAATPPMIYLRLIAEAICDGAAPAPLLAVLKHPLAAGGLVPVDFRTRARRFETAVLHGPRPSSGFASLIAQLAASRAADLVPWLSGLAQLAARFAECAAGTTPVLDLLQAHIAVAEAWAATDTEAGAVRVWAGEAGEAAASFVAELAEAARDFPPIHGTAYPAFFDACAAGRVVRPAWGGHPRLHILGPLEARLIGVDLAILGGLNEGTWPPEATSDPWMSRPMRSAFGLPAPERRVGLSAHDFAQACGAPTVVLTRAARVEGTPTVPSRWLQRLDAVLQQAGLREHLAWTDPLAWRAWLDQTPPREPPGPPAPRPPVKARPRQLSVTQIERWRRDPYAIYARHVLRLKKLQPIDADPSAADRGIVIHEALAKFVREYPKTLPPGALDRLLEIGKDCFGPLLARPGIWAFWWPRFHAVATWFLAHEEEWRGTAAVLATEADGRLTLNTSGSDFVLVARADRIDRGTDGALALIDYKTGRAPSLTEVVDGFAPQLPLEAAIAMAGGFSGVPAAAVARLRYWRLSGGAEPGEEIPLDGVELPRRGGPVPDPASLAAQAVAGVRALVERFDDPATPYHARPWPDQGLRYNDYSHLARTKEWSATEDET
ncbi:MAG: double-strand break repair protein AddB [Alphaproteobacteria bacterium]|nr:double-strand break repair protein AddB [Alphaproteobacteria bacterium]